MKELVVKKSAWAEVSFLIILACIFIIPLLVWIFRISASKHEVITFYEDKVVYEKGWLNKTKKNFAFTGVFNVNIKQTLGGRIFNYGHLSIDFVGKTDINTKYIKNPNQVVEYLETKLVKKEQVQTHMF